jgi:predicted  nucleic acid-binding Zn-ribbon protein
MDISTNSNGQAPQQRLEAALRDVSVLQSELDRTYQALMRVKCEQAEAGLDEVRVQLAELVAIGVERRAIRQDTAALVAQVEAVQDQHFEMQQRMAEMRRQWFAGKATDGAADTEEQLGDLQLRMATLRQQWVAREITSAAHQPDPGELIISAATLEAVPV